MRLPASVWHRAKASGPIAYRGLWCDTRIVQTRGIEMFQSLRKSLPVLIVTFALGTPGWYETQVPQTTADLTLSFAPLVKATAPAVVNIYATQVVEQRVSPFANDPFFQDFFRDFGQVQPRVQNSLGSCVVVSADGIVVSNFHVVGHATEIRVVMNDRREFAAKVILGDEGSDLAILRLEGAKDLPALPLRNSDEVEVGDLVLAIGNPFGVGQTVSSGIISGLARSSFGQGNGYFIQTDAAINPGNSGGALVDMQGRLLGINTSIVTRSGGSNGIGFAIPSNLVQTVVQQALAGAIRFTRPWAGVTGQAVDAALAEAIGLPHPDGVVLSDIHPESPFARAGVEAGDVILSIGGEPTNTPQEMIFRLATLGVGAKTQVVYLHGKEQAEVEVTLIAPPELPPRNAVDVTGDVALRGLSVARINPAVTAELGLALPAEGVVVTQVSDLAARVGLTVGDVLIAINDIPIQSPADVMTAASQATRRWSIALIRQGKTVQLRFRL